MKRADITDEQVIQACVDFHDVYGAHTLPGDLLMERTGAPMKVVVAAMERACWHGLIDYGVSVWSAFPTDQGRATVVAISKALEAP